MSASDEEELNSSTFQSPISAWPEINSPSSSDKSGYHDSSDDEEPAAAISGSVHSPGHQLAADAAPTSPAPSPTSEPDLQTLSYIPINDEEGQETVEVSVVVEEEKEENPEVEEVVEEEVVEEEAASAPAEEETQPRSTFSKWIRWN